MQTFVGLRCIEQERQLRISQTAKAFVIDRNLQKICRVGLGRKDRPEGDAIQKHIQHAVAIQECRFPLNDENGVRCGRQLGSDADRRTRRQFCCMVGVRVVWVVGNYRERASAGGLPTRGSRLKIAIGEIAVEAGRGIAGRRVSAGWACSQGLRMKFSGDDLGHILVVPGGLFAPGLEGYLGS